MMRLLLFLCIFSMSAPGAVALAQPSGGPPPAKVRVDEVRLEQVEPRREVTGELRASRRSRVASEEPGRVVSIEVEEGDYVEDGDVIVRLDSERLDIELERVTAQVRLREGQLHEQEVELERAQRDLRRIRDLRERGSASKTELDDAISDEKATEARVEQAQAELRTALAERNRTQERLDDMTINAPFAGAIVMKSVELGEWVETGASIVELAAYEQIDAWVDVPQQFIRAISGEGREISVEITAMRETVSAPVHRIVPDADRLSRMFPVVIRLDNSEGRLKPGMSVIGLAPTGEQREMLTIHKDAILRDDAGAYVYFNAGGAAQVARITPLFAVGARLVVRSPRLSDGVQVVIEGNERLFPGQPLQIAGGETVSRAIGGEQEGG